MFRRGTPPDATYTFKHALVQDAAYDSLLKSKRAAAACPRPSRAFARKNSVVPVERAEDKLIVAVSDPYNLEVVENIERMGYKVARVLSPKTDILKIITEFYGFRSSVSAAAKEMGSEVDLGNLEQFVKMKAVTEIEATDKHIVNAVEFLFRYAFDQRASDIHIEPKRDHSEVRFRIDGMLHTIHKVPKQVHPAFVSRIKMLSRLDIAEKRRPQDGRIKTEHKGREVEFRVSTMPVAFGEKVVLRIFDPDIILQDLDELGFSPREHELFRTFIARPHGIILVTGPTGSGKTTTLYSALKTISHSRSERDHRRGPDRNGLRPASTRSGVQPQIGLTFGTTLRTILRQDPDVIMVGEVRDLETAENAVQASLTGHLVLLDPAHQRCAQFHHPSPGPGSAGIPHRFHGRGHHGPAAAAEDLQTLRTVVPAAARRGRCRWPCFRPEQTRHGEVRRGLRPVPGHWLPR